MEKAKLVALGIAVALLLTTSATAGILPAGAMPGWADTVTFDLQNSAGTKTLEGTIEYAVYDTDNFNATTGTTFNSGVGGYLYAYLLSNDAVSNLSFEKFSMAISEGMGVGEIGVSGLPGGKNPYYQYFNALPDADSAIFLYMPSMFPDSEGLIAPGENSTILVFTSDHGPGYGYGSIEGGGLAGIVDNVAAPAPEPATIAMLGLGGLALVRNKRKINVNEKEAR